MTAQFKPTPEHRKQVESLAGFGIIEPEIARFLGIDPKTLRKYFADELATGHIKANAAVAQSLYKKALGDGNQSVTAAIFFLKTRAGWKETQVQQLEVGESFSDFFKAIDGKTRGIPTRG